MDSVVIKLTNVRQIDGTGTSTESLEAHVTQRGLRSSRLIGAQEVCLKRVSPIELGRLYL